MHRLPLFERPDEIRVRTWIQMVRTFYRAQRGVVYTLSRHRMTLAQFDLLATLRFGEGITQQQLAERLLVTKGNICVLLHRLERAKWVQRKADVTDARARRVYLTALGRRKIEAVLPAHDETILQIMRAISIPEAHTLRRLLESIELANESE